MLMSMSSRSCTFSIWNTTSSSQIPSAARQFCCSKTISLWYWLCWFLIVFFNCKSDANRSCREGYCCIWQPTPMIWNWELDRYSQWKFRMWLVVPVKFDVYLDINSYFIHQKCVLKHSFEEVLERFRTIYPNEHGQGSVQRMYESISFLQSLRIHCLTVHLWTFDQHSLMVTVRSVHGNASVVIC